MVRELRGENVVQHLDHLLTYPATLAYLLMDSFAGEGGQGEHRGALARRVRWLLANDRRHYDPARRPRSRRRGQDPSVQIDGGRPHRFQPFFWRRWDDSLAFLQARALLQIDVAGSSSSEPPRLRYGLTSRASRWLEDEVYSSSEDASFHSQICMAIADYLPAPEQLPERLLQAGLRLSVFRRDQRLTAGTDAAPPLFHTVFRERL